MQNNVFRLFQRTPLNICLHNMVATINKEFNYIIQRIWFNIPVHVGCLEPGYFWILISVKYFLVLY